MKNLMFSVFFIVFFCILSFSQDAFISRDTLFESQSKNWVFTDVIKIDSTISKDQIYQKAKQWFSEAFVSSKNVIDNADKDDGVIFGHVTVSFENSMYGYVNFNIEVRCKQGKVKYLLKDFMHKDAYQVNAYGENYYKGRIFPQYSIGPLTQSQMPESLGFNATGRTKSGREKMWNTIRNQSKLTAYTLIQSLKTNLSKESIKAKDSW